jgi:hypothetical protein
LGYGDYLFGGKGTKKMDRNIKYYLAGPMTGRPQFNYPLFDSVAEQLRGWGLEIFSPAEMDIDEVRDEAMANMTGDMPETNEISGETWGDFLARDVKLIADELGGIILLPEWDTSRGARLEAFVALNCGYPAYEYLDGICVEILPETAMEKINEGLL